jgi:hypothetical protein
MLLTGAGPLQGIERYAKRCELGCRLPFHGLTPGNGPASELVWDIIMRLKRPFTPVLPCARLATLQTSAATSAVAALPKTISGILRDRRRGMSFLLFVVTLAAREVECQRR